MKMNLKMTVQPPPVCGIECEDCSLAIEVKRLLGSIVTTSGLKLVGGKGRKNKMGGSVLE